MADMLSSSAYLTQALAVRQADAPNVGAVHTVEQAQKVAEDFESFFLSQIVDGMFAGLDSNGPFGGGAGEKAFSGLLHDEYAKVFTKAGGIGLSDQLRTEILRLQGIDDKGI